MSAPIITIVDYGLGNLFSVQRALMAVGAEAVVSSDPETVRRAARVVLPGVGAFADGMAGLRERGLVGPLQERARQQQPLLGICLGMQLFMTQGHEFGTHEGLGLLEGDVAALPATPVTPQRYKIPHMAWNSLEVPDTRRPQGWEGTLLHGLQPGCSVYFVHGYVVAPAAASDVLAVTSHGGHSFCSALQRGPLMGTQFHPEKSGVVGLQILRNFVHAV